MKNIALILTSYNFGGTERFAITLYKILEKLNYKVCIILITKSKTIQNEKVTYYCLDNELKGASNILKPLFLMKLIHEKKIDLIIDNRPKPNIFKTIVYELCLLTVKKIKVIHSNNLDLFLFKNKWLNQLIYERYSKIVCINNEMQRQIFLKFNLKNIDTIYNSIPEIIEEHKDLTINKPYILYFGRIENKSKDLIFLLEAYSKSNLIDKNINLIILGSGPDLTLISDKVNELNLVHNVKFIPALSNPFSYVKNAFFTVITSNYEGFPMSLIESLSVGIPIVSVNFGIGSTEVLTDKYNGLLVVKDLKKYTEALNVMIEDQELYNFCKKNTKSSIAHLTTNEISKKWNNLLKNI